MIRYEDIGDPPRIKGRNEDRLTIAKKALVSVEKKKCSESRENTFCKTAKKKAQPTENPKEKALSVRGSVTGEKSPKKGGRKAPVKKRLQKSKKPV